MSACLETLSDDDFSDISVFLNVHLLEFANNSLFHKIAMISSSNNVDVDVELEYANKYLCYRGPNSMPKNMRLNPAEEEKVMQA